MKKRDERPVVGFGDDYSRRASTKTMNAFVIVETRPCAGGADVTVTARRGFATMPEVEMDGNSVTVHIRKDAGPRVGETLMVGKRHVTVAERRWTPSGKLQVRDADSGVWVEVQR